METMNSLILVVMSWACLVSGLPPPHSDVIALHREEAQLHPHLKSPVWRNPRLLQILPLTSLLHKGEKFVFDREANKIPRAEIYKILTHAGFIPRNGFLLPSKHNKIPVDLPEEWLAAFEDITSFPNQDFLQYL